MRIIKLVPLLLLAVALATLPAEANLVPVTFGFPVIIQSGYTTAFNQDHVHAEDFEEASIDFPVLSTGGEDSTFEAGPATVDLGGVEASSNVLPFGPVNLAFPSISQNVNQMQSVSHTDFATTTEMAIFTYPILGVGVDSLPGFGFGW
jgi:hypothetical protein